MSAAKKPTTDWEKVERLYRAGLLSLREIASANHVTEGAIRKRAKKEGWSRDLQGKIKARADDLVRKAEVRKQVRTENAENERVLVEATAQVIAEVRMEHRRDIAKHRSLTAKLFEEIEHQTVNKELYEQLAELCHAPDEKGQDRRFDLFMKVIGTSSRVDSAKKLAETLKTLVALEREAYAMDSIDKPEDPITDLTDDELGARMLALLATPNA